MTSFRRLAFIGNSLPRRCGIATFTTELQQAVARLPAGVETAIVAMTDHGQHYDYPPVVRFEVNDHHLREYVIAAEWINAGQFGAVSLQHEFGIFGGESGADIMELLSRLRMPIVTTFHTVLKDPRPGQRKVMLDIIGASSTVVVMIERARNLLQSVYQVPAEKIELIPHGAPDYEFVEPDAAKSRLGFSGRPVILTFGLLSPNKGIEVMIDAMPQILQRSPDAVYVVLGATHPNLVRNSGESYRERLMARAYDMGVAGSVVFLNQFVSQATLIDFISMCDVYVTPYLNEAQMTSGTLAYSFSLGKAVVSTPYWHAQDLLADGRGILVPFGDSRSIGNAIAGLLTDEARRLSMRTRAYAFSRSMTWERTAERYVAAAARAQRSVPVRSRPQRATPVPGADNPDVPATRFGHLLSMCDDTGMLQHAVCSTADRSHGYCVDDNARGLLLTCALGPTDRQQFPEMLIARFAAFIQHAWNPGTRRFRNFMSFDRRWLEESGSEDCHGRTLWALGECARSDTSASRRQWAAALLAQSLDITETFTAPRAWAFVLLGLNAYCAIAPQDRRAAELRRLLADRLQSALAASSRPDWNWFEDGLAYDNARMPQAMIATGAAMREPAYVEAGLNSLRWLMKLQTSADGFFRPVGSDSFGDRHQQPRPFDQQPLEATATIAACLAAWRADGDRHWRSAAEMAFSWFLGRNDLAIPLVDLETGSCCDGLHADRANENCGAESSVSYLLALAGIRNLAIQSGRRLHDGHPPSPSMRLNPDGLRPTLAEGISSLPRY